MSAGSKGIASVAQNGTGDYTLTLQDTYYQFFNVVGVFDTSGASSTAPLAPNLWVKAQDVGSAKTLNFITGDYTNGAATNPASGEVLYLELELGNSSAY